MIIKEVFAKSVLDSRGEKTIEVSVNGVKASSPSGKSTGKHESPTFNKNINWNINFLNNFSYSGEIKKFEDLEQLEEVIKKKSGLKDVKKFGANALFAFECAVLKALAKENKKQLWQIINSKAKNFPFPVGNAVGGGLHSEGFKNRPEFQEFLIVPQSKKFIDNVVLMKKIYKNLGKALKANSKNDEGAWQTSFSEENIFDLIYHQKNKLEKMFSVKIYFGSDIAASSFFKNGKYNYSDFSLTSEQQISMMQKMILNHQIFYLEDPLHEEDFEGFAKILKGLSDCLVVGDDLTATQIDRLKKAISKKSINAMIIKPNQNGSLIELKKIFEICKKNKIKTIMSHRSGETLDDALADLAFGFQADFIKCGISTKWRAAKLNRMAKIEREIQN